MATIGSRATCPKCRCEEMEHEDRYGQIRAECPQCGYFYEIGFLFLLARDIDEEDREYETAEDIGEDLLKTIEEMGFSIKHDRPFRIGYIEKTPETVGKRHLTNTWFSIPSVYCTRPTTIKWLSFSKEELTQFDWADWQAQRIR